METLDMRGKPCPMPVLETKRSLANPATEEIEVTVDNETAVQNLERMAANAGYVFSVDRADAPVVRITIRKNGADPKEEPLPADAPSGTDPELVILIGSDAMGNGEPELGTLLMKGYIYTLTQLESPPACVLFVNRGAFLSCAGSASIADLKTLEAAGSQVLTCGTCLNYYDLSNKLAVGSVTDMYAISSILATHAKVVSL